MSDLLPKLLGLIALLGGMTIISLLLIALFRPDQLPVIADLVKQIVLTLIGKQQEAQSVKRKRKRREHDEPPN